jgi:hypothetical protein
VRTWLRYAAPLTLLAAIAFVPLIYVASRVPGAQDLVKARAQLRLGWIIAAVAWTCQLWLVAAVAPAVRALADGRPLSQWRALADGARGLVRAIVPWTIAVIAIVLGGVALVIPGLLLLVLLSLTGASERLREPPPAALVDSVAVVRANLGRIALLVGAVVVVDLAICFALQAVLVEHITKKVPPAKLLPIRTFVRTLPLALAALSPVLACVVAAAHARATRRTS